MLNLLLIHNSFIIYFIHSCPFPCDDDKSVSLTFHISGEFVAGKREYSTQGSFLTRHSPINKPSILTKLGLLNVNLTTQSHHFVIYVTLEVSVTCSLDALLLQPTYYLVNNFLFIIPCSRLGCIWSRPKIGHGVFSCEHTARIQMPKRYGKGFIKMLVHFSKVTLVTWLRHDYKTRARLQQAACKPYQVF